MYCLLSTCVVSRVYQMQVLEPFYTNNHSKEIPNRRARLCSHDHVKLVLNMLQKKSIPELP